MRALTLMLLLASLSGLAACDDTSTNPAPGPEDATLVDPGADAGAIASDAEPSADAAPTSDATPTVDAGPASDAALTVDAEFASDAALTSDAEVAGDAQPPADAGPIEGAARIRFGINMGHPNHSWGDDLHAEVAASVGCDSLRPKLPEYHLERWGYGIEEGDMAAYAALGMRDYAAFMTGPTRAHGTIPEGEPDWKRDWYIPANLYEPIWSAPGEVNPDNYWAAYLHEAMRRYHPWVTHWEIWNEPDFVSDWRRVEGWMEGPPTAEDLIRFNGSIFDYIRMLRIAWEVKEAVAPETFVATGGLGYPAFLDAVLRYTDAPDGRVSDDHPHTGGHYFETLSFHHYPHFSGGHSDDAAASLLEHKADFQARLDAHGAGSKRWIVTESGASGWPIEGVPSGQPYARNYLMKAYASAQADGIAQIHWFTLSDANHSEDATDPFNGMGLFDDLRELGGIDEARRTETGVAMTTLTQLLAGARLTGEAPILEGEGAAGFSYQREDGRRAWMVWVIGDEAEARPVTLEIPAAVDAHAWDFAETGEAERLRPEAGRLSLPLSGAPLILIEAP